ncbi:hypothetical protein [Leeia oryzae]|uniref:hypothetical protein n=1 Tax=Leeia oryzae TaxID=356662 RepID=UPI0003753EB1|nr:hypothetical protein [Leeia oryzae]
MNQLILALTLLNLLQLLRYRLIAQRRINQLETQCHRLSAELRVHDPLPVRCNLNIPDKLNPKQPWLIKDPHTPVMIGPRNVETIRYVQTS